ncbi:mechanosensitive ion channel domain-containing protein [Pseudoalteromonas fenneropenaei]|uniref:Small-conductance mechanosensitive channel n=1 Tax=Pseudoalteromonas fenneropenaei TaxID=1737459 RepID=A0ABV7CLG4_9GAMM
MGTELLALAKSQIHLIVTAFALLSFPFLQSAAVRLLSKITRGKIDQHRQYRAELLLKIIVAILLLCLLLVFWGFELRELFVVGSSLFAVVGVGLFAGWSLLSNLTSFLIMFVQNDTKVGNWVRVIDGANFVEGRILEMGLMNVVLQNIDGHRVVYPNNLFVTRPVMVLNSEPKKPKVIAAKRTLGPKK